MNPSDFFRGKRAVSRVYELAREVAHDYPGAEVERQRHTTLLGGETAQGKQKSLSVVTIAFPKTVDDSRPKNCKAKLAQKLRTNDVSVEGEPLNVTRYLPHTVDVEVPDARTQTHKR